MKPDVMVLHAQRPEAMAQLEQAYTLHRWDLAADRDAFLAEHGPKCRAAATNGHAPMTAAMLEAMPALELVACSSAGFDGFDTAAMAARGVRLTNSSPALCDDVADTAILLMLAARRGMVAGDAWVRSGDWAAKGPMPLMRATSGKVLGIVGMGTIGKAIARRAEAMGMQVRYWNRRPKDVPWEYVADLTELARQSDTLVAIVAGGEGTAGLISRGVLEALGPEGLFVNVSRGSVVDEAAMIDCLGTGRLGHAALDVYASEPDPDPRLTSLANTTLYPHHASGTVETRNAMAQLVVDNLAALFAGQALLTEVDLSGYLPQPAEA
ncbi:2-hydroxyacid dehydrogenase [Mangrovicoccus algicola]|uniref:2-hydroxyacid dehydrogenase n=1 Tax=Mangrovicoccus algicola TaxID=2771008 RepID=A0A8J6YY69_9RHOB|nr:2-hydroxyacid dehydrogenase [Mangrovicoccus algicola]MBE3639805.1 2-hydroxyacid dehydrogenase [Mangrovicoccus algicola]